MMVSTIELIFSLSLLLLNIFYNKYYINYNIITVTLLVYLIDLILIITYLLYKFSPSLILLCGGGYIYIIYIFLLTLLFLFLLSIYWQESTRLFCLTNFIIQKSKIILIKNTLKHEYFFIVSLIIVFFINLINNFNMLTLYINFEILSLLTLIILGFQITKETIKATILYFFYSFYSTVFLLWGLLFLYTNLNYDLFTLQFPVNLEVNSILFTLGYLLVILSFLIKLGVFPYHIWVIDVYTRLSNLNHIFLLSIISFGYLFSFLRILTTLSNVIIHTNYHDILIYVLSISAIGSTIVGALYLYYQSTFKGFFAANSIITNGFIVLSLTSFIELTLLTNKYLLLWITILYLFFYYLTLYVLYNLWQSFLLWNWKRLHCYSEVDIIYLKITSLFLLIKECLIKLKFINKIIYSLNNIRRTFKIKRIHRLTLHSLWRFHEQYNIVQETNWNLNYLNTIWQPLTIYYQDYYFYMIFWVFFGFPPFLLFILKFYIYLFILKAGLLVTAFIVSLLTNIFVTGALCRIITLTSIRLAYNKN